jgi:hypothetical protein
VVTAATVALAACGGDDGPTGPGDGEPIAEGVCTPEGAPPGWRFTGLGVGAKPAIAIAADGTLHAAMMKEAQPGWVRYTSLAAGASVPGAVEEIGTGYFYGPIDLLLGAAGAPTVLYHDHDRMDQVLGQRGSGGWSLHPMTAQGHDGWYNSGVLSSDGRIHTTTYDPSGFNGRGVVHGAWDGSSWTTDVASPGSFDYAGGMSLVETADGTLHAAFFDDVARVGRITTRVADGSWSTTTIEALEGRLEVGRFPDVVVDADGSTLHVVYLARTSADAGTVRYARGTPGDFQINDLTQLQGFQIGFSGARDLATLALSPNGDVIVASQTAGGTRVFRIGADAVQEIAAFDPPAGVTLGQQTEVEVDAEGRIHVVWWQSGGDPGVVCHAVGG